MFTLYPDAGARPLQVPRSNGRRDIAITQLTGAPPPALAGTFTKVMYLRVAALSGPAAPVLRLRADTGAERPLTAQFDTIFSRPGQEAPVGQGRLSAEPKNTWLVTIGFFADTSHAWTLGITNTATTADYTYTAIAADSVAATQHRWLAPTFTKVTCEKVHDVRFAEQKNPVSVSVDPTTHSAYIAVKGGSIFNIFNGNRTAVTTPADAFGIAYDPVRVKLFVNQPATASMVWVRGNTISGSIRLGVGPADAYLAYPRIALDSTNGRVYVVRYPQDLVTIVNADTHTVSALQQVGHLPFDVSVDPVTDTAYVLNWADETLTALKSGTVTGTLPAVRGPHFCAVGPGGGAVWTSGFSIFGCTDVKSRQMVQYTVSDPAHPDLNVSSLAVDPARYLVYAFPAWFPRWDDDGPPPSDAPLSLVFVFDSRTAAGPVQALDRNGAAFVTPVEVTPDVDPTNGLLHIGYGHNGPGPVGHMTVRTTLT